LDRTDLELAFPDVFAEFSPFTCEPDALAKPYRSGVGPAVAEVRFSRSPWKR